MTEAALEEGAAAGAWERARGVIAGGANSNARLGYPFVVARAAGARLYDGQGRSQIDYLMGMGPAILGHSPGPVLAAVRRSLELGQTVGATHELEIELAERVTALVPCAERVRFAMTGTEADQAAIRLARAHTGRPNIVKFEGHYHGWLDNVLISLKPSLADAGPAERPNAVPGTRGQAPGALAGTIVMPWNDRAALEALFADLGDTIAGVLMEPVMCNTGVIPPEPGYLEAVRELCTAAGAVLVFDEVITGFRLALGGAQALFGVTPDLAVFAKALAGGFPLSCLAGRAAIMELFATGAVLHGGTYNGNVPCVAAAIATLEALETDDGAVLRRAHGQGERLIAGLRDLALRHGVPMLIQGWGTVFNTAFTERNAIRDYRAALAVDEGRQEAFALALRDRGVRVSARGNWYVTAAHDDAVIDATLAAADGALASLAKST
jgi:glutamate-1-semialdehyde 2,1-aminomutase